MSKGFTFLWVSDPWERLIHPKETTLRLIQAAVDKGFDCFWCDVRSVSFENGKVTVNAAKVKSVSPDLSSTGFEFEKSKVCSPREFSQIHYRCDPPVDHAYLFPLQLLHMDVRGSQTEIVNDSTAIFSVNEKMEGSWFLEGWPSLISRDENVLVDFVKRHSDVVLKPLHDARGRGIERLFSQHMDQAKTYLKEKSSGFKIPVQLQKFNKKIFDGEVRLWMSHGKLMATMRKKPDAGEFKVNVTGGSPIEKHELSKQETKICNQIGEHLRKLHVRMAAVDLIDCKVTDFNITSPGLLIQIEKLYGTDFSGEIIESLSKPFE